MTNRQVHVTHKTKHHPAAVMKPKMEDPIPEPKPQAKEAVASAPKPEPKKPEHVTASPEDVHAALDELGVTVAGGNMLTKEAVNAIIGRLLERGIELKRKSN